MLTHVTLMQHFSMINYEERFYTFLKSQGCTKGKRFNPTNKQRAEIEAISAYLKGERKNNKAVTVAEQEAMYQQIALPKFDITRAEFHELLKKKQKTIEETYSVYRYDLIQTLKVTSDSITFEFVKRHFPFIKQYKLLFNFIALTHAIDSQDLVKKANNILEGLISYSNFIRRSKLNQLTPDDIIFVNKLIKNGLTRGQINNLNEAIDYFYDPRLKNGQVIKHCLKFLFCMGFTSPFDDKVIKVKVGIFL